MLTQSELKSRFNYNPETGIFTRLVKTSTNSKIGDVVNSLDVSTGYIRFSVNNKLYYGHRLAWLYMTGEWPELHIDHINGIRNDNRFFNLRECDSSQNMMNKTVTSSTSRGVTLAKDKKTWRARIKYYKKEICLGYFKSKEDAINAYKIGASKYFGEFYNGQ